MEMLGTCVRQSSRAPAGRHSSKDVSGIIVNRPPHAMERVYGVRMTHVSSLRDSKFEICIPCWALLIPALRACSRSWATGMPPFGLVALSSRLHNNLHIRRRESEAGCHARRQPASDFHSVFVVSAQSALTTKK